MRTLDEKELTDIMTALYDNRLKSLIGYESTDITRDIVRRLFMRFSEIARNTINHGYAEFPQKISKILSFMYCEDGSSVADAKNEVLFFVDTLENYLRCNLEELLPDWKELYPDTVYRKVFGIRFREILRDTPGLYPKALSQEHILHQLNYATYYRNQDAHKQTIGFSSSSSRYFVLYSYDLLLTYLLYTFFYMALEKKHSFVTPKS